MKYKETKNNKHLNEKFAQIALDSGQWLEHAQSMRMGANVILDRLLPIVNGSQPRGEIRVEMLGYVRTYMLLTGFAFENLLKAIAVSRGLLTQTNPKLQFETLNRMKGGHSIARLAQDLQLQLTQKEQHYLKRLEEYIYWGGRYPVPMTPETYEDSHKEGYLSFTTDDPKMSDALFDELSELMAKT